MGGIPKITKGGNINEIEKTGKDKGTYLIPELFNQPKEKGIFYTEKKK